MPSTHAPFRGLAGVISSRVRELRLVAPSFRVDHYQAKCGPSQDALRRKMDFPFYSVSRHLSRRRYWEHFFILIELSPCPRSGAKLAGLSSERPAQPRASDPGFYQRLTRSTSTATPALVSPTTSSASPGYTRVYVKTAVQCQCVRARWNNTHHLWHIRHRRIYVGACDTYYIVKFSNKIVHLSRRIKCPLNWLELEM